MYYVFYFKGTPEHVICAYEGHEANPDYELSIDQIPKRCKIVQHHGTYLIGGDPSEADKSNYIFIHWSID